MLDPEDIGDYIIDRVTESGNIFFAEHERIEAFRWYVLAADHLLDKHKEEMTQLFSSVFRGAGLDVTDVLANAMEEGGDVFFSSSTYQLTLGQMGFCRIVDNFVTYLKDLLSEVVRARPEVLKSREKERLDFILDFDSIDELHTAIAEKKVDNLFYGGIDDITSFFEQRLGIDLFKDEGASREADRLTKYRNLIVHNRGRINKQFLKEYRDSEYNLNDLLIFSFQDLSRHNLFFQGAVVQVDPSVAEKFGLERYTRREFAEQQGAV